MPVDDPSIFADKFRVASSRLTNWDYSTPGLYYLTICTLNHNKFFGKIINGKILLTPNGEIANKYWSKIPHQFTGATLNRYVIMPNHLHGIIQITDKFRRDAINRVSTSKNSVFTTSDNKKTGGFSELKNPMINQNLSTIIRWFKGISTRDIRLNGKFFAWQSRFYDHVIRDESEYFKINQYINNNPNNWLKDPYHL